MNRSSTLDQRSRRIPKASDILSADLRARILSEGLKPGDPLPSEGEIIEDYGFSRGTVREALRLLESEELIVARRGPKGGIQVTWPDASQVTRSFALLFALNQTSLRELMDFRLILEPAAASLAALNISDEQRETLENLAGQSHEGISVESSIHFHRTIGDATSNALFNIILTALHQVVEWETTREKLGSEEMVQTALAHARIADAVLNGDSGAAERAMRRHLLEFRAVLEGQKRLEQPIVPRPRVGEIGT